MGVSLFRNVSGGIRVFGYVFWKNPVLFFVVILLLAVTKFRI